MPTYEVDLYEGNELVTYEVDATSPEEAKQKAIAAREDFFQQEHTREGLERERAETERVLKEKRGKFGAAMEGFSVSGEQVVRGAIDSVLNMAEGVATLFGSGENGQANVAQAKIRNIRDSNVEMSANFAIKANERIAGRPLTEAEKARQLEDTAKFIGRGKFAADVGIGIAGGAATLGAKTIKGMIGLGTTEGALGGYLMADTTGTDGWDEAAKKRLNEATVGAVLGSALSLAPSVLVGAKNWMGNRITRAAGGPEALKESREALNRLGIFEATPAQLTGDPRLAVAERESAGNVAQEMFARQMDAAVQGAARQVGIELPPTSQLLEGSAPAIRGTMEMTESALNTMRGQRNSAFRNALDSLPDGTVIPAGKLVDHVNDLVKQMGEEFGGSFKVGQLFSDTVRDIRKAAVNGGLTPKQANAILSRLNGIQQTGRGLVDATQDAVIGQEGKFFGYSKIKAKELKNALMGAFDDAAEGIDSDAASILKQARADYGAQSKAIQEFEDAWASSIGLRGDPSVILSKLETVDTGQARAFVEGLRKMQGGQEAIDSMNTYLFREAVRRSSQAKAGTGLREGDFDISKFITELSSSTQSSRLKGLITPEQEKNLAAGLRDLRRLLNVPEFKQGVMRTRMPIDMQHLAINAVSRDPGFMARILGGAIQMGSGAENLFYTKAGQDVLFNAVNFSLKAPKTAAATQTANATMAYLASIYGSGVQIQEFAESLRDENMESGQ